MANNSGIYKITNMINNKFYIGSSIDLHKRKIAHFNALKRNQHDNCHLQRAYNKYKKENFEFEILILCPKEYLIKMEQWFIDNTKPKYNICKIAYSHTGTKRSKLTCKKISASIKGKIQKEDHKYNNSISHRLKKGKIYQYDTNNNLIKIWDDSIINIAKKLNINRTTISESIRLNRKSRSFNWKVESEVNNEQ